MITPTHTPLPWRSFPVKYADGTPNGFCITSDPTGDSIATVEETEPPTLGASNAAFIVTACNSHHELVDMVKRAIPELEIKNRLLGGDGGALVHQMRAALAKLPPTQ